MSSLGVALGLRAAPFAANVPNYAPAFLGFHFIFAYGVLSSRTLKQWYGIDHNESPRYDLAKYGDAAVASGKITQKQLDMLKRNESAHANAVENYTFFVGALGFATLAGVDRTLINRAGLTYTIARVAYGAVYILIDDPLWSQIRGITWWIGNCSCLYLLYKAAGKLNE
ncbi:Membrane-associated proteins in eicosanoid and glutathione metabolism [Madurella fahalii]|uniref:Membrane-associated proteins in eicosanoid and glutathione metabolism n=1 Tax=Madurella fahalii TaxID=1157608 RepID=A0ABQ0G6K1_9PEZI